MDRRKFFRAAGALFGAMPFATRVAKASSGKQLLVLDAPVAGFSYYEGNDCLQQIAVGDPLVLRREPQNAHDHRAIEIFWSERKLGYIPRVNNRALSQLMDEGESLVGVVGGFGDTPWRPLYIRVMVVV